MPTLVATSVYSVGILRDNGGSFSRGTGDSRDIVASRNDGSIVRVVVKFDLEELPAGSTVTGLVFENTVFLAFPDGRDVFIGPYDGDGQSDPETDSDAVLYAGCDVSGSAYVETSEYVNNFTNEAVDIGVSQAFTDVAAAAEGIFSLALRFDVETPDVDGDDQVFFERFSSGDPPELVIEYEDGGGAAAVVKDIIGRGIIAFAR